jgi:hypothetical protein
MRRLLAHDGAKSTALAFALQAEHPGGQ